MASARDRHALLLPTRQLDRVAVGLVQQAHLVQSFPPDLVGRLGVHFLDLAQRDRHVVQGAHVREEVELLEDHADALADRIQVALRRGDVDALDDDLAAGGLLKAVDAAKQGRLARAGRTDHDDDLLLVDDQVDALEDLVGAEVLVDVADLDRVRRRRAAGLGQVGHRDLALRASSTATTRVIGTVRTR